MDVKVSVMLQGYILINKHYIACNCGAGSQSAQCNDIGVCECISDNVVGDKCDMCRVS